MASNPSEIVFNSLEEVDARVAALKEEAVSADDRAAIMKAATAYVEKELSEKIRALERLRLEREQEEILVALDREATRRYQAEERVHDANIRMYEMQAARDREITRAIKAGWQQNEAGEWVPPTTQAVPEEEIPLATIEQEMEEEDDGYHSEGSGRSSRNRANSNS